MSIFKQILKKQIMHQEIKQMVDQQNIYLEELAKQNTQINRYEKLIMTQGAYLETLGTMIKKNVKRSELVEFVTKYGIGKN